jgi:hypothetical protein
MTTILDCHAVTEAHGRAVAQVLHREGWRAVYDERRREVRVDGRRSGYVRTHGDERLHADEARRLLGCLWGGVAIRRGREERSEHGGAEEVAA